MLHHPRQRILFTLLMALLMFFSYQAVDMTTPDCAWAFRMNAELTKVNLQGLPLWREAIDQCEGITEDLRTPVKVRH